MNSSLFALIAPRPLRLPDSLATEAISRLEELTANLPDGPGSHGKDLIEELRVRLKRAAKTWRAFEEATAVSRREWRLIWLYMLELGNDAAKAWLRPFDETVARSVLGQDGTMWHPARRRDITQFYFTQFDRIDALPRVAELLRQSWETAASGVFDEAARKWGAEAKTLFCVDGPERLAMEWMRGESAEDLADRYFVHKNSRFRERLIQAVLLGRLKNLPFGTNDKDLFAQIEKDREAPAGKGRLLGSRAVEIMVRAAIANGGASWPEQWTSNLVCFACDPRIPNLGERQRWWGWADEQALRVAKDALVKRNLEKFIQYLGESLSSWDERDKFDRRKGFLLNDLLGRHRVEDAQLLIQEDSYYRLDSDDRKMPSITKMAGNIHGKKISLIILKCIGGVTVVEGTHTYGIRCFTGKATPVDWVWKRPRSCHVSDIGLGNDCGAEHFYQAHQGDVWIDGFYYKLNKRLPRPWPRH